MQLFSENKVLKKNENSLKMLLVRPILLPQNLRWTFDNHRGLYWLNSIDWYHVNSFRGSRNIPRPIMHYCEAISNIHNSWIKNPETDITLASHCLFKVSCHFYGLNSVFRIKKMHFDTDNMMTSSNGSIFRVTGPLSGDLTGHRLMPLTKASETELRCFLSSAPE